MQKKETKGKASFPMRLGCSNHTFRLRIQRFGCNGVCSAVIRSGRTYSTRNSIFINPNENFGQEMFL